MRDVEVAILGAGLGGLSAASRLIQKGKEVIIIEKEDAVGGLCRSFNYNGFIFDLGGHRFLPHDKEIGDFVDDLFDDQTLSLRDRISRIYLKDKFLLYPPQALDIMKNLGLLTCFNSCLDSAYFRLRHALLKGPEHSLRDWLINRFGHTLYSIYFGPYSFKLWGRNPSHISSEWADQRISVSSIGVAIKSLFTQDHKKLKTYARRFLYPQGGIGAIPMRMAQEITKAGSNIFTGHTVTEIVSGDRGFVIKTQTSHGETKEFYASYLISTIPLTELVGILKPVAPEEILVSAESLSFRSVRFLNLMLNTPRISENTWLYVPERRFVFFRIQEFSNWHPSNVPKDKTSLTLEIACQKDGILWKMQDPDLLRTCINDLKKMGIDIEDKIDGYFSSYAEHAYPVYSLSYNAHLSTIYDFIRTIKNLVICGRQGLFRYSNMDTVIKNGFEAADALYDDTVRDKLIQWEEEKDYLERNLCLEKDE